MFLSSPSFKTQMRVPYFSGNGKSPETNEPVETNAPVAGDTFQPVKQTLPTAWKTATSALTYLLQSGEPSSSAPNNAPQETESRKTIQFAEASGANPSETASVQRHRLIRQSVPPGTRIKTTPASIAAAPVEQSVSSVKRQSRQHLLSTTPKIEAEGDLEFKLWQAMQDDVNAPQGLSVILEAPSIEFQEYSPHSSLILPSRTYSRGSTHPSSRRDTESVSQGASLHENPHYLGGDSDLGSEDLELYHEGDSSDQESGSIYDDEHIIARQEARKQAKSEKGAKTHSSLAPSVVSDIRENPHYLPGDSELDSLDLELYHDVDNESDTDSEYKSSVGKSAHIPIVKPRASGSDLFPIKSPDEVQQSAQRFQKAQALGLGHLSQSLRKSGNSELISSYQRQAAFEKLRAEAIGAEQLTSATQEKVKKICNKYTLEQLRSYQKDLGQRLHRWQQDAEQVAQEQGMSLQELQYRSFELDAKQAEINARLEQLSLNPDATLSRSEKAAQRNGLNQALEAAINGKTVLENHLESFKPITIGMDQTKLKINQVNDAIKLKLRHQLKEMPKDPQERPQFTKKLASTFTTRELNTALVYFTEKQAESLESEHILQNLLKNNQPEKLSETLQKKQEKASQESILLTRLSKEQPTTQEEAQLIANKLEQLRREQQKSALGISLITNYLQEKPTMSEVENRIKFAQAKQNYITERLNVLQKAITFQTVK